MSDDGAKGFNNRPASEATNGAQWYLGQLSRDKLYGTNYTGANPATPPPPPPRPQSTFQQPGVGPTAQPAYYRDNYRDTTDDIPYTPTSSGSGSYIIGGIAITIAIAVVWGATHRETTSYNPNYTPAVAAATSPQGQAPAGTTLNTQDTSSAMASAPAATAPVEDQQSRADAAPAAVMTTRDATAMQTTADASQGASDPAQAQVTPLPVVKASVNDGGTAVYDSPNSAQATEIGFLKGGQHVDEDSSAPTNGFVWVRYKTGLFGTGSWKTGYVSADALTTRGTPARPQENPSSSSDAQPGGAG